MDKPFAAAWSGPGAAMLSGIAFHLSIRNIEFELIMFHFLSAFTAAFAGMIYTVGLVRALLLVTTFNIGVFSSIGIYRLVFHRCRNFPGPLAAKLTRFYATRLAAKDLKYYKELAKLHEQYGDFVRTGGGDL
jgi:hypothetical protein